MAYNQEHGIVKELSSRESVMFWRYSKKKVEAKTKQKKLSAHENRPSSTS